MLVLLICPYLSIICHFLPLSCRFLVTAPSEATYVVLAGVLLGMICCFPLKIKFPEDSYVALVGAFWYNVQMVKLRMLFWTES